jgi:septum formation protein
MSELYFPGVSVLQIAHVALASGSPRRRELLARLMPAHKYTVISTDIDESRLPHEAPADYVLRLARSKAAAGIERWQKTDAPNGAKLVLAADTSVVLGDEIYGKPVDTADTARMLTELAGRTHLVLTGYAARLHAADGTLMKESAEYCSTEVDIRPLSAAEIQWYIATGEPVDKAGAYAVQGFGGTLVSAVRGDYYNVVGLPLIPLIEMLRGFEI